MLDEKYEHAVGTMMDIKSIYGVKTIGYDANGDSIIVGGAQVFCLINGQLCIISDHDIIDLDGESRVSYIASRTVGYDEFTQELETALYYDAMYALICRSKTIHSHQHKPYVCVFLSEENYERRY